MTLAVTHAKTSHIADDPIAKANGEVVPSDWNAQHLFTGIGDVTNGFTGASSFTAGALLYGNGTGALQVDASHLFYDTTNHGLAINAAALPVSTDKLYVNGNANIGGARIGTSGADVTITPTATAAGITLLATDAAFGAAGGMLSQQAGSGSAGNVAGGDLFYQTGGGHGSGKGGDGNFFCGTGGATGDGGSWFFAPGATGGSGANGAICFLDSSFNTILQIGPADNELRFGTYTAGAIAQAGYISIKDLAGNTRRLLVG